MKIQKPNLPVKKFLITSKTKKCNVYEDTEDKARKLFLEIYPTADILNVIEKEICFAAIII